jgi:hypothetical protein
MSKKPAPPEAAPEKKRLPKPPHEEPGSNAVEHEPDKRAEPVPDGEPRYVPRSPYTAGND